MIRSCLRIINFCHWSFIPSFARGSKDLKIYMGSVNFFKPSYVTPPLPSFLKEICQTEKGNSKKNISHFWFTRSGRSRKICQHAYISYKKAFSALTCLNLKKHYKPLIFGQSCVMHHKLRKIQNLFVMSQKCDCRLCKAD